MKASETFRFIEDFPDYLIGDSGTVYSTIKRRPLTPHDRSGYDQVQIVTPSGVKEMLIHRLVAKAFIPKPDGKDYIDHIDGNRKNNNVENLRWCTHQENDSFPLAIERKRNACIQANGKAVIQYDLDGNFIAEYRGQNEAGRITGVSGANISQACKGKRKSAGGFLWTYKNNNNYTFK